MSLPEAFPYYLGSLCVYAVFLAFACVRLAMHLIGTNKNSKRRKCGRRRCNTDYKSHTHMLIVGFLVFRTCDFVACILRCFASTTLCQNFNADSIHVVGGPSEKAFLVASLVLEGLSMCCYCTIFVYISVHWATVLTSNKSHKAVKRLWNLFVVVEVLVFGSITFLCAESAQVLTTIGGDTSNTSVALTTRGPQELQLQIWNNSLEVLMLILLLSVLMCFLYYGTRIYSRMANIYMLRSYRSQIVAEIVSSVNLKHALAQLRNVLVGSVGGMLVHAGFTVFAIVNRDPTFGPLANQPNWWLFATSWVPNLLPISLLFAWAWKVDAPQESTTSKQLDVDYIWNKQLRHLLENDEPNVGASGRPMVNVSADDHVGAVSFQAIAFRQEEQPETPRYDSHFHSFDDDILQDSGSAGPETSKLTGVGSFSSSPRGQLPRTPILSTSAPDARGAWLMKKAMRKPPMGLAAAAKYLGRRRLQAKQTAALLTQATFVSNWTKLLGSTVEDFVSVKPSTDPSLSTNRNDGTLWVSLSTDNLTQAALKQLFREESASAYGNVVAAYIACTLSPPRKPTDDSSAHSKTADRDDFSSEWKFAGMTEVLPQAQRHDFKVCIPLQVSFAPVVSDSHRWGHWSRAQGAATSATSDDSEPASSRSQTGNGEAADSANLRDERCFEFLQLLESGYHCRWKIKFDFLAVSSPSVYSRKDLSRHKILHTFHSSVSELLRHQTIQRRVSDGHGWIKIAVESGANSFKYDSRVERRVYRLKHTCLESSSDSLSGHTPTANADTDANNVPKSSGYDEDEGVNSTTTPVATSARIDAPVVTPTSLDLQLAAPAPKLQRLRRTIMEESLFESSFSLVVPMKMLTFIIRKRKALLQQAQVDHQQFYESITGTFSLGDTDPTRDSKSESQLKPKAAVTSKPIQRDSLSAPLLDRNPEQASATTPDSRVSTANQNQGDSYDSIVGALRTAADYEVRLAFLARRIKHRRRSVEEAEQALSKIKKRIESNHLFRSSRLKKKKGCTQFIATNLHLQRNCVWQLTSGRDGVFAGSRGDSRPSSSSARRWQRDASRTKTADGPGDATPATPEQFTSSQLDLPSPSPWKLLMMKRSESEPRVGGGGLKQARHAPAATPRSISDSHVSQISSTPSTAKQLDLGKSQDSVDTVADPNSRHRVHAASSASESSVTTTTSKGYKRAPRRSNRSTQSARSDASNTLSNRDIDIVSWIGYYFRRFHRLRSRSRRRDTCPPVDITDRTRKATAVFDTVTVGCPAAHAIGFKRGGIRQLIDTQFKLRRKIMNLDIVLARTAVGSVRSVDSRAMQSARTFGSQGDSSEWTPMPNFSQDSLRSGGGAGYNSSSDSLFADEHGRPHRTRETTSDSVSGSSPLVDVVAGRRAKKHRSPLQNRAASKSMAAAHAEVSKQLEELDSITWEISQRVDVVMCQAASALVTTFCGNLEAALVRNSEHGDNTRHRKDSVSSSQPRAPLSPASASRLAKIARQDGQLRSLADVAASLAAKAMEDSGGAESKEAPTQPASSYLQKLFEFGYILFWESLLSTRGKEEGMIGDVDYAVKHLSDFHFRIIPVSKEEARSHAAVDQSHEVLGVRVVATRLRQLDQSKLHARDSVPPGASRHRKKKRSKAPRPSGVSMSPGNGMDDSAERPVWLVDVLVEGMCDADAAFVQAQRRYIPTFAVLFTQGINEMQSVANRMGGAGLQHSINQESLSKLFRFCEKFRKSHTASDVLSEPGGVSKYWQDIQDRLYALELNICESRSEKNIALLQQAAALGRFLGAGRITICKSAKDRTSMSVTLEQSRLLQGSIDESCAKCIWASTIQEKTPVVAADAVHHVDTPCLAEDLHQTPPDSPGIGHTSTDEAVLERHNANRSRYQRAQLHEVAFAQVMRTNGVRRENARKNIGKPVFAFNAFQRKWLPEPYKPPTHTGGGRYS